ALRQPAPVARLPVRRLRARGRRPDARARRAAGGPAAPAALSDRRRRGRLTPPGATRIYGRAPPRRSRPVPEVVVSTVVPEAWMPPADMRRVIVHWTAGGHR